MNKGEWAVRLHMAVADMILTLPKSSIQQIHKALDSLQSEPNPSSSRIVPGMMNGYEIEAGNFRIVYQVEETKRQVNVIVLTLSF